MNVIHAYLETMFSPYPQTPRMLEAKTELQAMMEDAYQGFVAKGASHNEAVGRVITDFGNLDELAPVLGITGEIATRLDPEAAPGASNTDAPNTGASSTAAPSTAPAYPAVTLEEAQGLAEAQHRTRYRLAIAVALFVMAAIPLIVLPTAAESGVLPIPQNAAALIGLLLLFAIVAFGVVTIIGLSREFTPFTRLREGRFSRNPVVTVWAEDLAKTHDRGRITALQISVMCWVFSPAPVLLLSLIPAHSERQGFWGVLGVAGTLIMVAIGLLILLPASWANTVLETVTKGGKRPDEADDEEHSLVGVIASFYWPLVVAIYLAWSFIGNAWDRSWIIWPICGVLFGALAGGISGIENYRKRHRRG